MSEKIPDVLLQLRWCDPDSVVDALADVAIAKLTIVDEQMEQLMADVISGSTAPKVLK